MKRKCLTECLLLIRMDLMINFYKVIKLLRGKQYYLQILKCTFLLPFLLWLKLNIYIPSGASSWPVCYFCHCYVSLLGWVTVLQKRAGKSNIQVVQPNIIHKESKLTQAMKSAEIHSQFLMIKVGFIPSALCLASLGLRKSYKRKDWRCNTT